MRDIARSDIARVRQRQGRSGGSDWGLVLMEMLPLPAWADWPLARTGWANVNGMKGLCAVSSACGGVSVSAERMGGSQRRSPGPALVYSPLRGAPVPGRGLLRLALRVRRCTSDVAPLSGQGGRTHVEYSLLRMPLRNTAECMSAPAIGERKQCTSLWKQTTERIVRL